MPVSWSSNSSVKQFSLQLCLLLVAVLFYLFFYNRFFMDQSGAIGGDYSYFLPQLLSGYFWYQQNDVFSIPWFTPAFCGGLPFFPNPQSTYFSLPQLLFNQLGPINSVYSVFLLFAVVGQLGSYCLLKHIFRFDTASAFTGSLLFLFNGFYTSRMITGHLTYHVFMLVPLLAYCLLCNFTTRDRIQTIAPGLILPAMLMAYVIYAGAVNLMLPILISLIGVYYCYRLFMEDKPDFWYRFFISGFIALSLTAAKLVPAFFYIKAFPRDQYSLPGFNGLLAALFNTGKSLFDSHEPGIAENLVNLTFPATDIGLDFSIGILPMLIIMSYTLYALGLYFYKKQPLWRGQQPVCLCALLVVLLVPVVVNTYYPWWNELLKSLPYIKNSSLLTRWTAIDILPLVIISSYCLNKFSHVRWYILIATLSVTIVLLEKHVSVDRYKPALIYGAADVTESYRFVAATGKITPIHSIGAFLDDNNNYVMLHGRNDLMTTGVSVLNCYEPIFGYQLENFPAGDLFPGPIGASVNNRLNIKNPACYLFGTANQCTPGEHFAVDAKEDMLAFSRYQSYSFSLPGLVMFAVILSCCTLAACLLLLSITVIRLYLDR